MSGKGGWTAPLDQAAARPRPTCFECGENKASSLPGQGGPSEVSLGLHGDFPSLLSFPWTAPLAPDCRWGPATLPAPKWAGWAGLGWREGLKTKACFPGMFSWEGGLRACWNCGAARGAIADSVPLDKTAPARPPRGEADPTSRGQRAPAGLLHSSPVPRLGTQNHF